MIRRVRWKPYRGKTLCLTAWSIGEAAGLVVENWRFRRVGSPLGAAKRGSGT